LDATLRGCVLGFGDIFSGDRAVGCCVIDALLQLNLGPEVTLAYCGGDFRGIEAWMYKASDLHVVIGAVLGGRPGSVRSFDWHGLNLALGLSGALELFRDAMGASLTRLALIDSSPARVTFHIVEAGTQTGFGMTPEALRAARTVAGRILHGLNGAGLSARRTSPTDRLFRSVVLGRAF
jgi:Ni,Fe-hydrogenase maturation factor